IAQKTRRNIVTRGVPLIDLLHREVVVGDVRLRGIRLFEPCGQLVQVSKLPGIFKALNHRSGLKAAILTDGVIGVGDRIMLHSTEATAALLDWKVGNWRASSLLEMPTPSPRRARIEVGVLAFAAAPITPVLTFPRQGERKLRQSNFVESRTWTLDSTCPPHRQPSNPKISFGSRDKPKLLAFTV